VEHFDLRSHTYEESRIQRYLDRLHRLMFESVSALALPGRIRDVG
jgi:hypothetical protein